MFTIPVQKPLTPGEILERHFMEPLWLTQMQLADLLHVQRRRINEITITVVRSRRIRRSG